MRGRLLGLAVIALAVTTVGLLLDRRSLVSERERLETELEQARRRPPPPPLPPVPPPTAPLEPPAVLPPPPPPPPAATREERLAALLKELAESEKTPAEAPKERPKKDIHALQTATLDLSLPAKARVDALQKLRFEPDGRTPAVVEAMVQLLRTSGDDRIRTDICRHLKGVTSENLKQQLLTTVQSDPTSKVREEAAETLGPMNADPLVRKTLERVAQSDASDEVKEQAARALRPLDDR